MEEIKTFSKVFPGENRTLDCFQVLACVTPKRVSGCLQEENVLPWGFSIVALKSVYKWIIFRALDRHPLRDFVSVLWNTLRVRWERFLSSISNATPYVCGFTPNSNICSCHPWLLQYSHLKSANMPFYLAEPVNLIFRIVLKHFISLCHIQYIDSVRKVFWCTTEFSKLTWQNLRQKVTRF